MSEEATDPMSEKRSLSTRMLDTIERAGNKVPHPAMMFLYLIVFIMILSAILSAIGVTVTEDIAVPGPPPLPGEEQEFEIVTQTIEVQSLLDTEGRRFIYTSFVNNFAGFAVVAVVFVAMLGVGAAEYLGMMAALIRRLVKVAPRGLIAFLLIFIGVLSSVASDAGYLILIPLAAAAFMTIGRHPLAGMAAAFAGVGGIFAVNLIITPVDSMITEISNEALELAGGEPISIMANFYFSAVSSVIIALVALWVTVKVIEPRLGPYDPKDADLDYTGDTSEDIDEAAEARGLRFAFWGLLIMLGVIALAVFMPNGPLSATGTRDPGSGEVLGASPFLDSIMFLITMTFLVCGIFYGKGAGTMKSSDDVIAGITKTFAGLAGLVLMLLMISQFIAYFSFSNIPRVAAIWMAHVLESAPFGALTLLVGMILVIIVLDFILPNVVPKWAIFAPVFIPIFMRLGVPPQTVLAAYRIGDSPVNVITPLMVYLPFIVTVAQRYKKDAGLGTVVSLMMPYTVAIAVSWIILFVAWYLIGLPLGPGYPVVGM